MRSETRGESRGTVSESVRPQVETKLVKIKGLQGLTTAKNWCII